MHFVTHEKENGLRKAELNFKEMPLVDLHPAEYNPRVDLKPGDPEYQKIKRSIEEFGYADPIIINQDGTIIGGHQRYKVLCDLGYEAAQVVVVDVDKQREKALNLALNKISGAWDEEKVYALLLELDLSEIDMQLSGFERDELETLAVKFGEEAQEDAFDEETAIDEILKSGKAIHKNALWQLGEHRLLCGDATKIEDYARLMDGAQADLLLTDVPYNVDYTGKTKDELKIKSDKMSNEDYSRFIGTFADEALSVCKDGAALYVWHASLFADIVIQKFRGGGGYFKQLLVWVKNTFALGRADYQWQHEPCLYGWKEGAAHYFVKDRTQSTVFEEEQADFKNYKKSELVKILEDLQTEAKEYGTVLYCDKPLRSAEHPTMKPIPLFGRLIKNSSRQGEIVLDPFGGSGTTMIACEQLGRRAYLMEIDPVYCAVIIKRWEDYTGQEAVLLNE